MLPTPASVGATVGVEDKAFAVKEGKGVGLPGALVGSSVGLDPVVGESVGLEPVVGASVEIVGNIVGFPPAETVGLMVGASVVFVSVGLGDGDSVFLVGEDVEGTGVGLLAINEGDEEALEGAVEGGGKAVEVGASDGGRAVCGCARVYMCVCVRERER